VTERQIPHAHTILINNFLSPILCVLRLPTASRLPHCVGNWRHITTDPWVIQVVMGYKLELVSSISEINTSGFGDQHGRPSGGRDTAVTGEGCNKGGT